MNFTIRWHSEVYCFPFSKLDEDSFRQEMDLRVHRNRPRPGEWDPHDPNPLVPFPNEPTFVVQFQFYASMLPEHVNDPEPFLPGQVHGLQGQYGGPRADKVIFEHFKKNGINCTKSYGVKETLSYKGHPPHVLCRGFREIGEAKLQTPMQHGGGYTAATEPWIPLWQITHRDHHYINGGPLTWAPWNLQRYTIVPMEILSPVLPCTEESYLEVDRVATAIHQALRVQKRDGPGFEVRCESRNNFRWPGSRHRLPANLKKTLEDRFSAHVPQVDKKKLLAFAKQQYTELIKYGGPKYRRR